MAAGCNSKSAMFDHTANAFDLDEDSRPVSIQKQCWTCFRLFPAKVSTEVRCPRCLRKREEDFNSFHNHEVTSNGEKIPVVKLDRVPVIPDNARQVRVVGKEEYQSDSIINLETHPISTVRLDWIALRALAPRAIQIGPVFLDFSKCRMTRNSKTVPTTKNEWRLLALLCAEPGHIVPRFVLTTQTGHVHNGRCVDTLKAILNKKLDKRIKTLNGIGYYLEVPYE